MVQNGHYEAILGRVPSYIEYLENFKENYISATILANALNLGEVQVRKDLAKLSCGGKPKIGYVVDSLLKDLKDYMGYNTKTKAVIIGMGRLGEALYHYQGFSKQMIKIVAAFDIKEEYLDLSELEKICKKNNVDIGIITVPKDQAQTIADALVRSKVKAIWNFAPIILEVPETIVVRNENMASSLSILIKLMNDLVVI